MASRRAEKGLALAWMLSGCVIKWCVIKVFKMLAQNMLRTDEELCKNILNAIRSHNRGRIGDRKSWDLRAPMIWDNFSIFRTICTILVTCIRAERMVLAERKKAWFSRGCCHCVIKCVQTNVMLSELFIMPN